MSEHQKAPAARARASLDRLIAIQAAKPSGEAVQAQAITAFVNVRGPTYGPAGRWLVALQNFAPPVVWPATARGMAAQLSRLRPSLLAGGFDVRHCRRGKGRAHIRVWGIWPRDEFKSISELVGRLPTAELRTGDSPEVQECIDDTT